MAEDTEDQLMWEYRLALWLPGPPFVGMLLIAGVLITVYMSFVWFFNLDVELVAIFIAVLLAFILMAPRYTAAQRKRVTRDRKITLPDTQLELAALQVPYKLVRRSRLGAAAGVLLFLGIFEIVAILSGADAADLIGIFFTVHDATPILPMLLLLGWLFGRGTYLTLIAAYDLHLPNSTEIDLLNLEHLYSIGRSGLPDTLVWFFVTSLGGLIFLATPLGLWGILPSFSIGLILGLLVLLRPAREVRNLIRTVKQNELGRLESKLLVARDDAMEGDMSTQGRLADLLAYQTHITSIPEWSFDSPTLVRFGLYLLIPVGSMIGGAFVELAINSLIV